MSKLRFTISMSLDGFVAGSDQTVENPLGIGGEQMHDWVVPLEAWRKPHGMTGGEINASSGVLEEIQGNIAPRSWAGTCSAGTRTLGPGRAVGRLVGRQPAVPSPGVRADPPRSSPAPSSGRDHVYVRDRRDRFGSAPSAGRAGGKDVALVGGAKIAQQYLAVGLVDQMDLNLVPVFLDRGERLFENLGSNLPRLELVRAVPAPGVTHLRYRLG